jgi:tyrosyl-tRNA synthetase
MDLMSFVEMMRERGLVAQITHEPEFLQHCKTGTRTAYIGFDPTADSLHVGHLTQVMTLSRWQKAGHRVIAVMGGGTAMVGDPTGKTEMRQILTQEQIDYNISRFKAQVQPLLDFSDPRRGVILNNADWLLPLNYLDFLRNVGRHFSVNRMLSAECFKSRMEKGLSFLEFNYMLLQSYDFAHLFKHEDCSVQLGGDDQWSNILAGVELIHRMHQKQAYCLTTPLLATSDGRKMGKTEKGAVWIDPQKTSPYEYFQFWRNIPDDTVSQCLRVFTYLSIDEVRRLEALTGSEINQAKILLAFEATKIMHGEAAAAEAQKSAEALFAGAGTAVGNEPEVLLDRSLFLAPAPIQEVLVTAGIFASKGEARRMIEQGGIAINDKVVNDFKHLVSIEDFDPDSGCLVRKGKKHYYRLRIR